MQKMGSCVVEGNTPTTS